MNFQSVEEEEGGGGGEEQQQTTAARGGAARGLGLPAGNSVHKNKYILQLF